MKNRQRRARCAAGSPLGGQLNWLIKDLRGLASIFNRALVVPAEKQSIVRRWAFSALLICHRHNQIIGKGIPPVFSKQMLQWRDERYIKREKRDAAITGDFHCIALFSEIPNSRFVNQRVHSAVHALWEDGIWAAQNILLRSQEPNSFMQIAGPTDDFAG
ncbi:hypothetical protein I7I51_02690 [Histoplasma capsulatum]|uniref:Uncharacterized protein n=1 Tax=Ajellomyces capsulatus TaxID=5037 RepID=A0A8A1MPE8_AJECA|nr:hypothetical protein I7I51_02690 [Histoplasma capsulatum]